MTNSERYQIVAINGQSDSTCRALARMYFAQLLADDLAKHAFYDGYVTDPEQFVSLSLDPYILLFIVVDMDLRIPAAHFHLTSFTGRSAMVHFSLSKSIHGTRGRKLTIHTLGEIFKMTRKDGSPLVTSLTGLTPLSNKLACRFIKQVGFEPKFTLKDSCAFADGHHEDGLVTLMEAP